MVMVARVCILVCVYMTTPSGRGGDSISWQRVPLSRLALPVNRDVQYSAVILYNAVISIIMHYTSRLIGHARRDNGRHCLDNALPPPRRVGVAVYYDPLLYSRHNGRDRTVKVGREINQRYRQTVQTRKRSHGIGWLVGV